MKSGPLARRVWNQMNWQLLKIDRTRLTKTSKEYLQRFRIIVRYSTNFKKIPKQNVKNSKRICLKHIFAFKIKRQNQGGYRGRDGW